MGFSEEIIFKYYLGEGEKSAAIILEANEEKTRHFDKVNALVEKYGADAAWGGRATITALAFKCEGVTKAEMKEGFLRPKVEKSQGQRYAVYSPDKRYKAGKEIAKELSGVGAFNFSDYIIDKLGLTSRVFGMLDGRQVMVSSVAGQYGSIIIVKMPFGGDSNRREVTVPQYLREIKKSEFIAITEEAV